MLAGPLESFCRQDGKCIIPTCKDLSPYCTRPDELGLRARQYCPVTCGCNTFYKLLFLNTPSLGCTSACRAKLVYSLASAVKCDTDAEPNDPKLRHWLETLKELSQGWSPKASTYGTTLYQEMNRLGCRYMNDALHADFEWMKLTSNRSNITMTDFREQNYRAYCGGTFEEGVLGPWGLPIFPILPFCPVSTLTSMCYVLNCRSGGLIRYACR